MEANKRSFGQFVNGDKSDKLLGLSVVFSGVLYPNLILHPFFDPRHVCFQLDMFQQFVTTSGTLFLDRQISCAIQI